MWARVSTYQFPSGIDDSPSDEGMDASVAKFIEALGQLQEPGLQRAELLIDRASGKALTITVWDDQQALEASGKAANQLRSDAAHDAGVSIVAVTNYEILEPAAAR